MNRRSQPVCEGCGRSVSEETYRAFGGADQCPFCLYLDMPYPDPTDDDDPRDQWRADR